jgi:DNA polymerase III subunit epsilon
MFIRSLKQRAYKKKLQGRRVPLVFKDAFEKIKRVDRKTPIRRIGFVVMDTETTGLSPHKGDILLSIAGIGFVQGRVDLSRSFYELIRPEREIPRESVKIHHLTPGKLTSNPVGAESDVLTRFFDFCQGDVLVGHHVSFDIRFINHALQHHFDITMANKVVDTAVLARAVRQMNDPVKMSMEEARPVGLDELAQEFHISMPDRHDAYGDAFATALVFQRLVGMLEKNGVKTYKELLRLGGVG